MVANPSHLFADDRLCCPSTCVVLACAPKGSRAVCSQVVHKGVIVSIKYVSHKSKLDLKLADGSTIYGVSLEDVAPVEGSAGSPGADHLSVRVQSMMWVGVPQRLLSCSTRQST